MESIGSATAVTRKGLRSASGRSRKVRIDQRVIDREIERQRRAGDRGRRYLVDSDCPGLRLVLYRSVGKNEVRAAWTYSYRPRGADSNGRRLPQRTMRLGDLTTLMRAVRPRPQRPLFVTAATQPQKHKSGPFLNDWRSRVAPRWMSR